LFYSQLRKRRMELESENKTSQEEGLAPAGSKGTSNTLIPHNGGFACTWGYSALQPSRATIRQQGLLGLS